ncbi:MAG: Holliday junction branch migration protein RuvA [Chloroflexi bacterium]|nr:Holliday junction branch migration protein RuvA [Chloroflexota bacterium]
MISSLQGKLEAISGDWAVINVHGIGFQVYMPTSTVGALGTMGSEVRLYTHLHLREDGATLYGFSSTEDRQLFHLLLGVSSIGPRLALGILSSMTAQQLSQAIAGGDLDMLTSVPGIGKKTASRLVLELKDKIGEGLLSAAVVKVGDRDSAEVAAALAALGYSAVEAARAAATLPAAGNLSLEEKVKLTLRYFNKK